MVTVCVAGGLGNQMFICAYAKALQIRGYKVRLDIEGGYVDVKKRKNYKLSKSRGWECIYDKCTVVKCFKIDIPTIMISQKKFLMYILKNDNLCGFVEKLGFYKRCNWLKTKYSGLYTKKMAFPNRNSYIVGYFNNEYFFKEYRKEILKMFRPRKKVRFSDKFVENRTKGLPVVSLHFRRTDFVNDDDLYALEIHYYINAINYLEKKIGKFDICVFSDDCEWVKENFRIEGKKILYPSDYKKYEAYEEMYLMSLCDHNIIANSTFSWWGAWLNQNKKKIVIAPARWDLNNRRNFVPKEWIRI